MSEHSNGSNGNGGGRFAMRLSHLGKSPAFRESIGFSVAELVSMGVSLGVVGVADQVAPHLLERTSKLVAKVAIEPYLNGLESIMSSFCKLEECKVDTTQSREERAQRLAHTMIVFSSAWAISMAAKFGTRRVMNHMTGIKDDPFIPTGNKYRDFFHKHILNPDELRLAKWDEGVHYGSLILLNTGAAKYTDDLIRTNTSILKKCGISEKKAHELSSMAMIWELPNFLGLLAGVGVISHKHGHDWGQHK